MKGVKVQLPWFNFQITTSDGPHSLQPQSNLCLALPARTLYFILLMHRPVTESRVLTLSTHLPYRCRHRKTGHRSQFCHPWSRGDHSETKRHQTIYDDLMTAYSGRFFKKTEPRHMCLWIIQRGLRINKSSAVLSTGKIKTTLQNHRQTPLIILSLCKGSR